MPEPVKRQPRRPNGEAESDDVRQVWPADLKAAAVKRAREEGYTFTAWLVQLVREALEKPPRRPAR